MKVSTFIARFLKEKGIETVFELQGGMITRIIDALHHEGGIKIVSMHHEQAAAMAADAYGRITNKPGIALATSGPGATNLLTGIGNCYFDSVPAIFITGQVNISEKKGERLTRQIGFQETNIVPIVQSITKAAFDLRTADEVPFVFEKAYSVATEGRPGPVLIDIPMNLQHAEINNDFIPVVLEEKSESSSEELKYFLSEYLTALKGNKKPLVLVGRGIRAAGVTSKFLQFIEKYNIPVVCSLLGLDNIPYNHPNRIGFIGTYGNRWANYALGNCDLLLVLGSRLDLRQTGTDTQSFQNNKIIFHVDIDKAELNNRFPDSRSLNVNVLDFLRIALNTDVPSINITSWLNEINEYHKTCYDTEELKNIKGINPNIFIHALAKASLASKVFISDVGNNQMWTAQSLEINPNQLFITSGGMGAMGYALPAAIGSSIALHNKPVVCISGDGGFQINIQELQTIKRNKLPVKIVIFNNHCLGMIRQFQDAYFDSCYQSTVWGYDSPDFVRVADAYGIGAYSITESDEIEKGLSLLWEDPTIPFLLNVNIDVHTNVFPKMMFGSPITNMEPSDL